MSGLAFVALALGLNALAALAALIHGSVSRSGAAAGLLVGASILLLGGFLYWIMLMVFFITSSLASRIGRTAKRRLEAMHEKGSRRDAVQVLANGGVAAGALVAFGLSGAIVWAVVAATALAAATADTWASELGVLSRRAPRSLVTGRPLEPGTSGGVSLLGTFAAVLGSATIALWLGFGALVAESGSVWSGGIRFSGYLFPAIGYTFLGGVIGSTLDSVLGATVQAQYRTPDGALTERAPAAAVLVRGIRWMNNDAVNLLSTLGAAAVVATVWLFTT